MAEARNRREQACLDLLRATKTDNEKLASLLLVPKLFSMTMEDGSGDSEATDDSAPKGNAREASTIPIDKEFQRELIAAIDFKFLKRMLAVSDSGGDKGEASPSLTGDNASLKSAALSVILCFTQPEVLTDTQVSQIVTSIESILALTMGAASDSSQTESEDSKPDESWSQLSSLCVQCLENFMKDQENSVTENTLLPTIYRLVLKQTVRGQ